MKSLLFKVSSLLLLCLPVYSATVHINYTDSDLYSEMSDQLEDSSDVSIITIKSEEGLEIMRHTLTAQVLAQAVKNIYPDAKLAIGPTIDNGFYYDFYFNNSFSIDDLKAVEDEMRKIIKSKSVVTKTLHTKDFIMSAKSDGFEFSERLTEQSKVEETIERFINFEKAAFLEVVIDPDAMVFPMIGPGMSYDQMITGPFMEGKDPDPEIDGNDPKSMF